MQNPIPSTVGMNHRHCLQNSFLLCITPYLNLVSNMGFRKQAKRKIRRMKRNAYPIMPLVHPEGEIQQDYSEDRYMFKHLFRRAFISLFRRWLKDLEADGGNNL